MLETADHQVKLISKYILDAKVFDEGGERTWNSCLLRYWLNSSFLKELLPEAISTLLKHTDAQNPVSLLSFDEYYNNIGRLDLSTAPTNFANANLIETHFKNMDTPDKDNVTSWWLSDGGANSYWNKLILEDGQLDQGRKDFCHGVRPVLTIDLRLEQTAE